MSINGKKQFKIFERMFSGAIRNMHEELVEIVTHHEVEVKRNFQKWTMPVASWDKAAILHAVYEAEDTRKWQVFRAALKGLKTDEKLYCLLRYYNQAHDTYLNMHDDE